ncbi:MAG TPA: hypothetical protein VHA70_10345 [Bauldia sp.]|nr:hypothetical protein [Bauldia sp.]
MDIEFARLAIRAGFSSGRELETLIHITKAHWEPAAHKEFAIGIARATAEIQAATTEKAVAAFPELEAEVDAAVNKYGRY